MRTQSTSPFRLIASKSKHIDENYIESRDYLSYAEAVEAALKYSLENLI